jgi:hypothetical protein
VHEEVRLAREPGVLEHALDHEPCRDLERWIRKTLRYADVGAAEAFARGERAGWSKIALRPAARFAKQYFWQRGFLDGLEGFLLCAISAFGVFWKYCRLWERSRGAS